MTKCYGRLPARFPAALKPIDHYIAGPLPTPPAAIRRPGETYPWGMLGNGPDPGVPQHPDGVGDCGVAGLQHGMEAAELVAVGDAKDAYPTAAEAVSYYLKYTGGQDSGVVLADFLAYVRSHGYYGHTVSAFAPVNHQNVTQLRQTIALFDMCYTGIQVTARMEDEYDQGLDWTLESLDSQVVGGHCVPLVSYGSHRVDCITWGKYQRFAWPAFVAAADEAWAVMTGELKDGDGRGVNYQALLADLAAI